jgi:hypothetical protein
MWYLSRDSNLFLGICHLICHHPLYWGAWNFLKIRQIKEMLAPTLVRNSNNKGGEVLLPPRYENKELEEYEARGAPAIINSSKDCTPSLPPTITRGCSVLQGLLVQTFIEIPSSTIRGW